MDDTRSHKRGGSYICSKHDAIIELCNEITLENAIDIICAIKEIAKAAKEDGQNMEDSLSSKRALIDKLNDEIRQLEDSIQGM